VSDWDQFGAVYDHSHFADRPRTYLIASTPRSGSHYLGHLLFGTGEFGSPLEYFQPGHMATWKKTLEAADTEAVIRCLFVRRTSPSGWFGVKAHWSDFAPICEDPALLRFLDLRKYIRIVRRDTLSQAISLALARQTGAWISFHSQQRKPVYDPAAIRAAVAEIEAQTSGWDAFFREHGIAPIEIAYEDLLADPGAMVDAIRAFFDLDARPASVASDLCPERQASDINLEWRRRYIDDLRKFETLP
jgi:LPS sulfotransferase NodH